MLKWKQNFLPPPIAKYKAVIALKEALIARGFKKSLFYIDDDHGGTKPVNLDAERLALLVMNVLMPPAPPPQKLDVVLSPEDAARGQLP